jgi:hypothetical protein
MSLLFAFDFQKRSAHPDFKKINLKGRVVVSLWRAACAAKRVERVGGAPEQVYDGYPAINRQSRKSQEKTLRTRGYWHRCGD